MSKKVGNEIVFTDAVPYDGPLLIGVAGGTGSGKTLSAIKLARGLKGDDGLIAVADTEHKRALLYKPPYDFKHFDFRPPHSPERFIEVMHAGAELVGSDGVLIVDNASHEWIGDGGVQTMAEEKISAAVARAEERANPGEYVNPERFTAIGWGQPKQQHKRFLHEMTQVRCHLILSFRAEPKVGFNMKRGKMEVVEMGLQPVTGAREDPAYDCLMFLMFDKRKPGRPQFTHKPMLSSLVGLFGSPDSDGFHDTVTATHGRALRYWRTGMSVDEAIERAGEDARESRNGGKRNAKEPMEKDTDRQEHEARPQAKREDPVEAEPEQAEAGEDEDARLGKPYFLMMPGQKKPVQYDTPAAAGEGLLKWGQAGGRTRQQVTTAIDVNDLLFELLPELRGQFDELLARFDRPAGQLL